MGFKSVLKAVVAALPFLGAPGEAAAGEFSGDQIRVMFFSPQDNVSYPVCVHDGRVVARRAVTMDVMLHGHGNLLAFVSHEAGGEPVITVDEDMLSSVAPVFRDFVIAHECAHIQSGHIDAPRGSEQTYRHNEDEADCTAIRAMKEEGLGLRGLAVIETHNRALVQAFFPAAAERGAAERRNAHIRACYDGGAPVMKLSSITP